MGNNGNTGIRVCEGRKIPKIIVDKIQQRNWWKKNLLI